MSKIKIFRVITSAEVVNFHLKNFLRNGVSEFDIYVIGSDVSKFGDKEYPGVNWIEIEIPRKISIVKDILCLLRLIVVILREKPSIIHSIMPKAGLIACIAGFICNVPTRIHTFTGQVWSEKTGLKRGLLVYIDKLIVALTTTAYTDSKSQSLFLLENKISQEGAALPYLGEGSLAGVDLKRFDYQVLMVDRNKVRDELGLKGTTFIFVGRKCRDKGVFDLVTSFMNLIQDGLSCSLILVGPDETDGHLDKNISNLCCESIVLVPATNEPEKYIIAADIFCLPSYREGFGSVVIEAAALKRPCIGTRINGLTDSVVDGETGLLVPTGNSEELCNAMRQFIQNPEIISIMGDAAYRRVKENFSSDYLYRLQAEVYSVSTKNQAYLQ
ncbi:glycosyltransferase family 4 protein [Chitinimonas sp. PSY-7]|uniref:glycosyltransferase n=1 Tax=Chitinimonas sp. PSY-7 TaxID=3459088 RepID=UPI004040232A